MGDHLEFARRQYGVREIRADVTTNTFVDETIIPALAGYVPVLDVFVFSSDTETDATFESASGTVVGPQIEAETDFSTNYPIRGARGQIMVFNTTVSGTGHFHALYHYE